MKFKDYLKKLNRLAEDNPDAGEYEVVTSSDDEGNSYGAVYYDACVGEHKDSEFDNQSKNPNAVCLN